MCGYLKPIACRCALPATRFELHAVNKELGIKRSGGRVNTMDRLQSVSVETRQKAWLEEGPAPSWLVAPQHITQLEASGRIESRGLPFHVRWEDIQLLEGRKFPLLCRL